MAEPTIRLSPTLSGSAADELIQALQDADPVFQELMPRTWDRVALIESGYPFLERQNWGGAHATVAPSSKVSNFDVASKLDRLAGPNRSVFETNWPFRWEALRNSPRASQMLRSIIGLAPTNAAWTLGHEVGHGSADTYRGSPVARARQIWDDYYNKELVPVTRTWEQYNAAGRPEALTRPGGLGSPSVGRALDYEDVLGRNMMQHAVNYSPEELYAELNAANVKNEILGKQGWQLWRKDMPAPVARMRETQEAMRAAGEGGYTRPNIAGRGLAALALPMIGNLAVDKGFVPKEWSDPVRYGSIGAGIGAGIGGIPGAAIGGAIGAFAPAAGDVLKGILGLKQEAPALRQNINDLGRTFQ